MLHVQNKYEKCSRIYQDSLQNLPDPSPNSTHLALDAVCWYVIAQIYFFVPSALFTPNLLPLSLSHSYKNATRVAMHRMYHSLNINPFWFTSIYFQLFSRIRNMHGAHRLVAFFCFLMHNVNGICCCCWFFSTVYIKFNFTILRFTHQMLICSCIVRHFFHLLFSFCSETYVWWRSGPFYAQHFG